MTHQVRRARGRPPSRVSAGTDRSDSADSGEGMADALGFLDGLLGDVIEGGSFLQHRLRLSLLGHGRSVRPPRDGSLWAAGDPPPRTGNALEPLIDGEEVLPRIEEAIRAAGSHVYLAGWSLTPSFALTRGDEPVVVRELLAAAASSVQVRVLLWAGAPVPVIRPTLRDTRRVRDALTDGSHVKVGLDRRPNLIHCYHEKLVIVDDETAFVGGLNLTDRDGDRYDCRTHPYRGRLGWHDLAFRIRGPLVADVARHFTRRWVDVTGERLPEVRTPFAAGDIEAQLVSTVPERRYSFAPKGEFRILESYQRAMRSAMRLVYLENQFFLAPEVARVLAAKLRHPPSEEFRVVIVLPARANQGRDDTRGQLQLLEDADRGAGRLTASTISAIHPDNAERVYVHAKTAIIDDRWLTIGSANLNCRGLYNDGEANIVTHDPGLARRTRLQLWAEHLRRPTNEIEENPARVIDEIWRPIAREQRERAQIGAPQTHPLIELSGTSRRASRLLGALEGLVVDS